MIKKYPWHAVYLVFVVLCLFNIFQKLKWSAPTDRISWKQTAEGLVCEKSPGNNLIQKGDLLLTVNKYVVTNLIDLQRVFILKRTNVYLYGIEHEGIARDVAVDRVTQYTPFSYYVFAFAGIFLILLTLNLLNIIHLKRKEGFSPPFYFYIMTLTFSGFLIFSPTGSYNASDFVFLFLDRFCFILFPSLLLHYSLYFPIKLKIVRMQLLRPNLLKILIYMAPTIIIILNIFFIIPHMVHADSESLLLSINNLRRITSNYFSFYLALCLVSFMTSNLWLIFKRKQARFILPLIGACISIPAIVVLTQWVSIIDKSSFILVKVSPFLLVFLPISLIYYLGHRKFTDIENIIKKTIAIASIFVFIFFIFFILGSTIEQNKLLGIFWSVASILTAGLLFKPIEETAHKYFERVFFRGIADFKNKLSELIQSFRNERNLYTIVTNFLNTINNGFQLQKSAFVIHRKKNVFFVFPEKKRIVLSHSFINDLFRNENLIIFSPADFQRKYPKDFNALKDMIYYQFLPLKTQDRLVGFISFGPKEDHTYLSLEDWEIMFSIDSPLTLSVENAYLYSELETQFNEINLLKEFNENIIENINLGIVVLTNLNIIKTWNDFMEAKFKVPAAKAIGTKAHNTFGRDLWKEIYKYKQPKELSTLHNVKVDISNTELTFDIQISPLKDSSGKVIGNILVFEDVTEKVSMQNQLITTEKMASLGLLSAGVAHEVNTPLTGISSYCQFIIQNPGSPDNIDLVLKIQEQVIRANKIIRTLLDFSRQKGELPTELDLNKVINESVALVEHNLKKKNITLHQDFNFRHKLYGYSSRLQQMIINLIINASDAVNDSNGVISISGSDTDRELGIRIKDNGHGIDPKYMKKIFDPFFTTKEKGKGTGLGLSISYSIIKEHYGEITVNSKLNKGTTFNVTFPIKSPLRSMKI